MVLHVGLHEREADPAAAFPPRYQGIEDAVADFLGHARPVIDHLQFQCQLVALAGNGDLAQRTWCAG